LLGKFCHLGKWKKFWKSAENFGFCRTLLAYPFGENNYEPFLVIFFIFNGSEKLFPKENE
jgi:hypothetical protein